MFPVGGVAAEDIAAWLAAGAAGFGFGSELFRPEYSLERHRAPRAASWCRAFREARRLDSTSAQQQQIQRGTA